MGLLFYFALLCCILDVIKANDRNIYTNTWAVHVANGEQIADSLASKHGFKNLGQILPDIYLFEHQRISKRSVSRNLEHHENLSGEAEVLWLEQQVIKSRVKRNVPLKQMEFNDPLWTQTWYLTRDNRDMGVRGAWQMGVSGRGAVVTILDDGIEKDHPDLAKNYDPDASYDVNDHDPDPQPRYDPTNENRHGTRCAGEVAAEANNSVCTTGIAFGARIGGVRMLDGDVTDAVEAQSLSLNPQHVDIYSASWGPDDDGRTVDGPGPLARKAFQEGIDKGRRGLGSIYVWASGNGGRDADNCNCDGYTNSVFTLSISSATEAGNIPWYSEACASTLATTYSSGSGEERQIVTTDLRHECTETHTGTSASAPLAAGMCALALEANPQLTWRDMQYIVLLSARPAGLNAADWLTNGVGRQVSHSFGYGMMDAEGMVTLARNWTGLPEQHRCDIVYSGGEREVVGILQTQVHSNGCSGSPNEVVYLEHVQVSLTLSASHRGQVEVYLTSPMGTRSMLLARRPSDMSNQGFRDWLFMTTHSWGELSVGEWTLEVKNGASSVALHSWTLVLYGTVTNPHKLQGRSASVLPTPQSCQPTQVLLDGQCVTSCPPSYAIVEQQVWVTNATTSEITARVLRTCERCDVACETCLSPHGNCLKCRPGLQLYAGSCELEGGLAASDRLAGSAFIVLMTHVHKNTFFLAMATCLGLLVLLVGVFVILQVCDRTLLLRSSSLHSVSDRMEQGEKDQLMHAFFESDDDGNELGEESRRW